MACYKEPGCECFEESETANCYFDVANRLKLPYDWATSFSCSNKEIRCKRSTEYEKCLKYCSLEVYCSLSKYDSVINNLILQSFILQLFVISLFCFCCFWIYSGARRCPSFFRMLSDFYFETVSLTHSCNVFGSWTRRILGGEGGRRNSMGFTFW